MAVLLRGGTSPPPKNLLSPLSACARHTPNRAPSASFPQLLNNGEEGDDVVPFPGTPRGTAVSDTDTSPHPPKRRSSCKTDDSPAGGDVAATTAILMG